LVPGVIAVFLWLTLGAGPAAAYVGPGAGISLIGAAAGLVLVVISAIGVVLRQFLKRPLAGGRRDAIRQPRDTAEPCGE
jgi:hypothetical protein